MKRHFHEELNKLKQKILKMGHLAEEMIQKAIQALLTQNEKLAKQVFEKEKEINYLEIEIDDFGHSLLALDQPMAVDLRLVIMILKINTDLERIGDHAVNIAEQAANLSGASAIQKSVRLTEMAQATMKMLSDALRAFVDGDVDLARDVLKRDDEIDDFNNELYRLTSLFMEDNPQAAKDGIDLIMVGHNLERVADLANNIAEDVVYMKQGKEVRHHIEKTQSP
jgi:phosphate transport system protein